jgi:alpha-glucosidase (family GH31 glycosyl hydrolase)
MKRRECLKLIGAPAAASWMRVAGGQSPAGSQAMRPAPGFGASSAAFGAPGRENAIVFRRFLRAGGFPQVTPTTATVWWDRDLLHVEFHNTELDPLYRGNPGLAKPVKFPGNSDRFGLSAYPDAVYVQFRPDWKNEQVHLFAVDSSGASNSNEFSVRTERQAGAWTAHFQISWDHLGGRPVHDLFGLNLVRSRGQSSEVLSPIVLDQTLNLPPDLLTVCSFGEKPELRSTPGFLAHLSGQMLRWQLPEKLLWPDLEERRTLWREQQTLGRETGRGMLSQRVRLAQRLHDTLVLEGFSFHTDGSNWPVRPGEFYPHEARIAVNGALRNRDFASACRALDVYLHQLDRAARRWFADESPGNVRALEWVPVTSAGEFRRDGRELRLNAVAGKFGFPLWLGLSHGAIRLRSRQPGYFQPDQAELVETGTNAFQCGAANVEIQARPWRVVVRDRTGRTLWSLGDGDLSVRFSTAGEVIAIDLHGSLAPNESFYGFGERFKALGQRANVVTLWDVDCWDGNIHGQLNQAYKNVPLMHSTRGHSLFWNTSYRLRADIGNADPGRYRMTAFGDVLDLFVWPAKPQDVLRSYTEITGKPMTPPRWAFEPWMGGGGRRWRNGPLKNAVLEEIGVVKRFRDLDIPHSAIYAEAGNDDPALYASLKDGRLRVLAWVWASMDIGQIRSLFPDLQDAQLPALRHADGSIAFRDEKAAIVDYTHPLAAELLRRFWKPRFDLGLAGSMADFGDVVPGDAVFYNGKRGVEMHNFYAYFYHQVYAQVFQEARGNDYVLFARAGCAGDQHSICYFAGDHQANFFGMRAALRGGLNAAACGLSNWGADAGGYSGWPDPEVYIRWTEWAAFCPLMRYHGTTPREPWEFGDDAVAIYKRYAWLRENLLPYIESSAQEAHETGIPLMRPMPLAFPDSPELANCDDQYLFGPDILVAPVLGPGESRTVLLPPGRWTDFWTAESFLGARPHRIATPIDRIGVFLRPGAFVPVELAPSLVPGESMTAGRVKAVLATGPEAGARRRAEARGAEYLVLFGDGAKRVIPLSS